MAAAASRLLQACPRHRPPPGPTPRPRAATAVPAPRNRGLSGRAPLTPTQAGTLLSSRSARQSRLGKRPPGPAAAARGLGSSSRGDKEDQRTTSPRKLPTTSKLRKMNPIFSLIFLRRRETHRRAQPPPQLSPPSFPLLRLSSSLPHPCRFGCRPLHCLPFPAPDPELPSALPSPGLFPPPPPLALRRPPQSSNRPVCLALLSFLSTCPLPDPQSPSSVPHCPH